MIADRLSLILGTTKWVWAIAGWRSRIFLLWVISPWRMIRPETFWSTTARYTTHPNSEIVLEREGFHFRGHSDTEILLRAYERWGTGCFDKLRGMFALALWDARRQRLLIARDHLGIKPLYYAADSGSFVCASEVRALLKSGLVAPEIDDRALPDTWRMALCKSPLLYFGASVAFLRAAGGNSTAAAQ